MLWLAVNIGGTTIHSWAGVGLALESAESLARDIIVKWKNVYKRWIVARCLVVDEVSMLSAALFDKLETIARIVRRNDKPFG